MTVATRYGPSGVRSYMKYRFYYTGIRVRNLTRSLAFYTKAFGMRVVNRGTMRMAASTSSSRGLVPASDSN